MVNGYHLKVGVSLDSALCPSELSVHAAGVGGTKQAPIG